MKCKRRATKELLSVLDGLEIPYEYATNKKRYVTFEVTKSELTTIIKLEQEEEDKCSQRPQTKKRETLWSWHLST